MLPQPVDTLLCMTNLNYDAQVRTLATFANDVAQSDLSADYLEVTGRW
jgi:hypothetical protein